MRLPSQIIAERYQLQLSPSWVHWFDDIADNTTLPGCFRHAVDVHGLCNSRPTQLWPGFMLPDTLPLLGNGYGDWICVRVDQHNQPAELIHWYHGGGDWIPVGRNLADAILHDLVDLYRPVRKQMLRGAVETSRPSELVSDLTAQLRTWLQQLLADSTAQYTIELDQLLQHLSIGNYSQALQLLIQAGIAVDAAICDSIELIIQQAVPSEHSSLLMMSETECQRIEELCQSVIQRRHDLGWSFSLLGWCQLAKKQQQLAHETFFAGRFASAFSDQSVRLRLHKFEHRYGKYSIAQLVGNRSRLTDSIAEDPYLKLFLSSRDGNLVGLVQEYWLNLARQAMHSADFANAYHYAYNAGWDIGAASMAGYRQALEILYQSAKGADWQARAAVAKANLDCM